jgi:non-specific serine/threonine protein kinase
VVSNPDLDAELDRHADREGADPLKALKRRLTRHEFRYLTDRGLEAALLRREVTGQTGVPGAGVGEDAQEPAVATHPNAVDASEDHVRQAVWTTVRDDDGRTRQRELAPHAIGAAALYAVVTRLEADDLPDDISLLDKAELYETGELRRGDEVIDAADVPFSDDDGRTGIPVTYTRDVVADVLTAESERSHPDLPVEQVVTPDDLLDAMKERLADAPVFSHGEVKEFENRHAPVAAAAAETVSHETVAEYVENVYAWDADEPVETERGPEAPDALAMKVFETETLGRFDDGDYRGTEPTEAVAAFRREQVIRALTRYTWRNRGEAFSIEDVELREIPELKAVLETNELADLKRRFPELDPGEWADPPADTETARLKAETIERMVEQGYSPASAELTSRAVMRDVREEWTDLSADGGDPSAGGDR